MLVAITGGIGCGKSLVSQLVKAMGYAVYDCDSNAKKLMLSDESLKQDLIKLFGGETYYPDGSLNKKHLSACIFSNPDALQQMNSLVHPAVARDIIKKYKTYTGRILFFESAILFESHFDQLVVPDKTISVSSPLELRIKRVSARDNTTRELILKRINSQISQEEKDSQADYVIFNDEQHSVITQLDNIIKTLL